MVPADRLLRLMLRSRPKAFDLFDRIAESDGNHAANIAWEFLQKAGENGFYVDGGRCRKAAEVCRLNWGEETFESQIRDSWSALRAQARENISYLLVSFTGIISNELAMELALSPASRLLEKQTLISSLTCSAVERQLTKTQLLLLLDDLLKTSTVDPELDLWSAEWRDEIHSLNIPLE